MIKIFKNFISTLGNVIKRPLTINYPQEKIIIPEGSKGKLHVKLDLDTLEMICEDCGKCAQVCPKGCIRIIKEGQDRKEDVPKFLFDAGGCIFCGNCIEACRLGAMEMSYEFQLAEFSRNELIFEKIELVRQADYTIKEFWSK